jgi:hypothetical protein
MSVPHAPTTCDHLKRLRELRQEVENMRHQCGFAAVPKIETAAPTEQPIAVFPTTGDGAPAASSAVDPA